mgnify:CR=1 FL=1
MGNGGLLNSSSVNPTATAFTITPSSFIQVPAGATYYFEVRATVAGSTSTYNVATTLLGDTAYPTGGMSNSSVSGANLVWSPNATTTASATDNDWTNGFGLQGLPSSGVVQNRTQ